MFKVWLGNYSKYYQCHRTALQNKWKISCFLLLFKSEGHKDDLRQILHLISGFLKPKWLSKCINTLKGKRARSWIRNFSKWMVLKKVFTYRLRCSKRQANKCSKQHARIYKLQHVVYKDQLSLFCSKWSQKDYMAHTFCSLIFGEEIKHFKGKCNPIF